MKLKSIFNFLFLFILFFIFNLIISPLNLDEIWNYGFSLNIYNGLIPYKDFNMVITPLYPFINALFFHIFGNTMLIFHIINALLDTILIYYMKKNCGDIAWILLPFTIFPLNIIMPNYNLLLLVLFFIILYLEKNNKNDYLIGFLIGLSFLTKQSVGIFLIIPSILFYFKDYKKLLKRVIAFIIPCVIFLIYLLISKSLYYFLDLCLFGLIDFNDLNGGRFIFLTIVSILMFLYLISLFIRKKGNIYYCYLMCFFSVILPIFDLYHLIIFLFAFFVVILPNFDFSDLKLSLIGKVSFVALFLLFSKFGLGFSFDNNVYPNDLGVFKYRYMPASYISYVENIKDLYKKYNYKVIFIGPDGYFFKILENRKITKLDLINNGNFGYKGSQKMFSEIICLDSSYVFFVKEKEIGKHKQTNQDLIKYIIKNGIKIDHYDDTDIYRLRRD